MPTRRRFLGAIGVPTASALAGIPVSILRPGLSELARELSAYRHSPSEAALDEDFWAQVSKAFTVDRSLVNLNNGGVSPSPAYVQEAMKRHLDYSNEAPTYTMWRVLEPQREGVRQRVARQWGCDPEEVAFTRNASESLQTLQLGYDLQRGDEVLTTTQDYPRMITTFQQRERREGIIMRQIQVPIPSEDPREVVKRFQDAITDRTRLILMCHMVNITGQILPVKEIVGMARSREIPVIVDGAHALAHFVFNIPDLDCDNYSASLHKWLFAPHGTGFLFVRRDRIKDVWPLMAAPDRMGDDIRKFEEIGTHPAANYLAIGEALTFHQAIGPERKEARLLHLRDYWARQLVKHDRVRLHTSLKPGFACGIATVEIRETDPGHLSDWLWDRHRIITTPIDHPEFQGIRVSPSVYTTLEELDRFVEAMEHVVRFGLPAAA